jgi:hypothetical protein
MTEKEKPKNAHQRLLDAMLEVGYVQNEDKTVNNQYRYVSHNAVVGAVRPVLLKHGLIIVSRITEKTLQMQEMTETVMVYDKQKGAKIPLMEAGKPVEKTTMGYVCTIFMELDIINAENPSDKILAQGYGMGIDSQDKATGKAISYAKKSALINGLLLEAGDDPEKDVDFTIGNAAPIAQAPKHNFWKTAKERTELYNAIMKEMNDSKNLDDLAATWVSRTEHLNALKASDAEIFNSLETRKNEIKKAFTNMENK